MGGLEYVHGLRGKDALQELSRLHGKELAATDGYVAHYERNGSAAMLYASRTYFSFLAERQLQRMADRIRKGNTPFYHLKSYERSGATVFSALGEGQINYFYRRGADVIWIASDPAVAKEVAENLLPR